ncbi:MAG: ACT domain-containing protein [Thermincola sp.]|nr:ACT domain-containing protein [Thermincola sp.]MDT3704543.1 ACT domain-containing protein [Thermincola sp.]
MKVQQISVFLENKSGRLAQLTEILGNNGINIRALSIADTSDFGILRLIVSDPLQADEVLKNAGFTVSVTDVIAVEVKDVPGGLTVVLQILEAAKINIEYLYAFLEKSSNNALVVLRVEQINEASELLAKNGIELLENEKIHKI